jgi:class 3 adenylate cyclase/tetratricopeptide (TPR) repeat protein
MLARLVDSDKADFVLRQKQRMTEREQLEQAIATLDGQRAILGDAVVDAALAPMRAKLAELKAQATAPEQKRKQVTVLFADVSGFTAMSETLDAEEVTEIMNALWARLDGAITAHGGQIDKHIGDCVMALWGVEAAREDDSERAIRAALETQAALAMFREARGVQLAMRIGLSTGPVLLGEVGSMREFTAMGDTVNLASRLEHAAPVGGILISHDTYRHVRGVFDVLPQAPLTVKGKTAPVQTYVVQRAKPRAFHMGTRGVEGIETRMVEREAELWALQSAFVAALEAAQTRLVTVVGEAGVGKSRLLYEFENWLELRPELMYFFKGRAAPALQSVPYGIVRDMFAYRFDILESDSAAAALEKFRAGMAGILAPARADLVGHLIGFDFSASPAVQNLLGGPGFGKLATAYLTNYVQALAQSQPLVMFLEDLHWADDSSLDLIEQLVKAIPQARLLLVGLTRPTLFERRPHWGAGQAAGARLDLKLLSKQASRALVDEILQKVDAIPAALRDLIVEGAEGNPFYMEELVKMLMDEGVIERGPDAQSAWRVNVERLQHVRVPPTLTGILQARLDSLPHPEREALQRAAVVGRLFWDAAVAELAEAEREQLGAVFDAIRARELIFRRERSAFAGTQEYLFKHALLHDVTYETVLLKLRRGYHARVARWLELHAGERIGEYAELIAGHLERAGQAAQAAGYLRRAGEKALATSAFREAVGLFERALALLPAGSPERVAAAIGAGEALVRLGEHAQARRWLEEGLALAQKLGDEGSCAEASAHLGGVAFERGEWTEAMARLRESIALARQIGDKARLAHALLNLGWVYFKQGAYLEARTGFEEGLALHQELGNRQGQARALDGLGSVAVMLGEYKEARSLYLETQVLHRELGDRRGEATALSNLGEAARLQADYAAAQSYYLESLPIAKETGNRFNVAITLGNLGHAAAALGDYATARSYYGEALQGAMAIGTIPFALDALAGLASVQEHTGQPEQALELLGLVMNHPSLTDETRQQFVKPILARLRAVLPAEAIEAGLERGKLLQLETVVAEILRQALGTGTSD